MGTGASFGLCNTVIKCRAHRTANCKTVLNCTAGTRNGIFKGGFKATTQPFSMIMNEHARIQISCLGEIAGSCNFALVKVHFGGL